MNGVDAVVMATGNDWRAVEAGAHAYAARNGRYSPLAVWRENAAGELEGKLEMPLALGVVGGAVRAHPGVRLSLEIAGISLGARARGIGWRGRPSCSNLAALESARRRQEFKGYMALHARSVASFVGATGEEVESVAMVLAREGDYRPERALTVLKQERLKRGRP